LSERSIRVIGRLETESWRDETRSLNDGASYIVKANSLEIRDADGSAREIIHLDSLRDLNRDETRVAFRPQGDRLVNLNAAALDDASHLEQRLRTVLSGSQTAKAEAVSRIASASWAPCWSWSL
jgi:hypothetical protein